jgi:SH3-like domain-containing protein
LGAEKNAVVRISVASQYRDAKYGSELINQALMGTEMRLLKKMDGWYYVQLPDGYLGWMSGSYMVRGDDTFLKSWHDRDKVVVRRPYDLVRMAPKLSAAVLSDVVQGIQLAKISVKQGWVEVELPDGRRGFLETASVVSQEDLGKFKPTAKDLESTAQEMLGFPYLWGGTSVKGMDCSGFTVSVYRFNNVTLPRDADMQSNYGQAVELDPQFNQLKKGDLLFFGPSADKITHVGMYLDNARFIHCSGLVKINSLRRGDPNFDADLLERLRKARRILN